MSQSTALSVPSPNWLLPPALDLSPLTVRVTKGLWLNPTEFMQTTHALAIAEWAVQVNAHFHPSLSAGTRRGPKQTYHDRSIIVMALVHVAWQFSYDEIVDYFRTRSEAAHAAGFDPVRVISVGQYWERRRALGVLPFWLFFIAMVGQLVRRGVIHGTDLILDATTQHAWFHADSDAGWSFPKPWKGSVWGYKVHTVLCRWSQLPVMFLVTSANRQEIVCAIPLLLLSVACFGFTITVVRADAGYFSARLLYFICDTLQASVMIDYNVRRRGKHFLATLFFLKQWRFHQRPRTTIERHFAWAKRYFGLETARWRGLVAAYQHTALVYSVMLGVALAAHRYQRPDLAGSRTRVLALKTVS